MLLTFQGSYRLGKTKFPDISLTLKKLKFPWHFPDVYEPCMIQKVHILLHTPLLNKTPRLSSARMFVRLNRLLLLHCIYVSVTKPTCPAFSAWLNTGASDPWRWHEKLLCSVVTALTSTLCAALHGQSNVGSMCDCKPCWSLDVSVLVEILSGVDSDHGTGPRRNSFVNSRSTLCPIESRSWLPKTLL